MFDCLRHSASDRAGQLFVLFCRPSNFVTWNARQPSRPSRPRPRPPASCGHGGHRRPNPCVVVPSSSSVRSPPGGRPRFPGAHHCRPLVKRTSAESADRVPVAAARLLLLSAVPTRVGRSPSPLSSQSPPCALWSLRAHRPCRPLAPACCCARRKVKETLRALLLVYPALYPFWCGGAPTPFL